MIMVRLKQESYTGRPRITTKREDRAIVKLVKKDRFKTAAAVFREMSIQLGKPLSRKTVSHRLVEQQLFTRSPVVKPLISSKNKKCRLAFANEHVLWSQEKWQTVHFSDEVFVNWLRWENVRSSKSR